MMPENQIEELVLNNSSYKNKDGSYNKLRHPLTDSFELDDNVDDNYEAMDDFSVPHIDDLLTAAANNHASDVHIIVGTPPKYRIDGELVPMGAFNRLRAKHTKQILETLLDDETKEMFERDGDLDFAYSLSGVGRFRVNLFKQRGSWAGVFRLLNKNIPSPEELGIPKAVVDLADYKRGIILVTGPTGSGKSTTLASLIDIINSKYRRNIITLEDPIEYLHKHKLSNVAQREMGIDSKNFASGLRAALREDPDVILVGEMRDYETISTAITAAETGHLVLSTLHTTGAADTINRIIDTYPAQQQQQARNQLANCFQGIISQQLVPKVNGGRVAVFEVMLGTDSIRNVIREGKTEQLNSYMQASKNTGMCLLDDSLQKLALSNKITPDMAVEYAVDKNKMKTKLFITY